MDGSIGKTLRRGDSVGFVYHPGAYNIYVTSGVLTDIAGTRAFLKLVDGTECYTVSKGEVFQKLVKVAGEKAEENESRDAIGQKIKVGDIVVFQEPVHMGNTCHGFEEGGVVSKITASYIFTVSKEGIERRKKNNGVVVIKSCKNPENGIASQKTSTARARFLAKYDNKKPYGWVCYSVTLCPPMIYTHVISTGMTKEETEANAEKKYGESIHCATANQMSPIEYCLVSEAAYRKLKNAKTLDKFHYEKYEGVEVRCYDED